MDYSNFVQSKLGVVDPVGFEFDGELACSLFPHQHDLTRWALRRGRAAIFADTGLGKMRMEIAYAKAVHQHTNGDVLIVAPLAVAQQIVAEAASCGVTVALVRVAEDVQPGINVINYARLHLIDASRFVAVVLDESSIIKHQGSKTFQMLCEMFERTPYKLCATATPAPNDWTELGNHAEFLNIRSRSEMLAEFFVHDGGDTQSWKLKGHAQTAFWRWVASWGAVVRSPADLGYDATAYNLPPLDVHQHTVQVEHSQADTGMLFAMEATDLMARRQARKESLAARVTACADTVNATPGAWVVWCDLNDEGKALRASIPDAIEVSGADSVDEKERKLMAFANGQARVLISKPSICGFGLNWQHCANMAFVGVTDSWEAYYQAVRRCYRFGQTKSVQVHIFASEQEGSVVANLARKERDAKAMQDAMVAEVIGSVRDELRRSTRETNEYQPRQAMNLPSFLRTV